MGTKTEATPLLLAAPSAADAAIGLLLVLLRTYRSSRPLRLGRVNVKDLHVAVAAAAKTQPAAKPAHTPDLEP